MKQYRGHKWPNCTYCDTVCFDKYEEESLIGIRSYSGAYQNSETATVTTATARKIAADLTRMADAIDTQQGEKA